MNDCIIPQESYLKRKTCMLIITHNCNLSCKYCYERHKDGRSMSFEVAKQCVLQEIDKVKSSDKYDELEIDFMGGEPFMNFALMKQVVEWLEACRPSIPWITFATTNGTLIGGTVKEWVEKHKDHLCLGLSYDGDDEMQSLNRGTPPLDMTWYAQNWPKQGVRMTISKETLPQITAGVISLSKHGVTGVPALAHGVEWDEHDAETLKLELGKMAAACLSGELPISCVSMLTRSLDAVVNPRRFRRFCGSGDGMIAYDVDGTAYPCHMFSPVVLGDGAALDVTKAEICKTDLDMDDPFCKNCSISNWCPTCYGFNHRVRGDVRRRDHTWCKMMRAVVLESCKFQLKYYLKHKVNIRPADFRQINAATKIYRRIMTHDFSIGGESVVCL